MIDDRQPLDTDPEARDGAAMSHPLPRTEPAEPVTWDDFVALPDDDRRELIDGALVEVEVPNRLHEWIVSELLFALKLWCRAHGGVVLASGYKVRIAEGRAFMPDVQLYRDRRSVAGDAFAQGLTEGAPDLAIEVISPGSGRYDRVIKFNGYAAIGAAEYWLIDPEVRLMEQFVLEGEHYRLHARLTDDALFEPKSFPDLSIPLADLWTLGGAPLDDSTDAPAVD